MVRRSKSRAGGEKPEPGFFEQVGRAVVSLGLLAFIVVVLASTCEGDAGEPVGPELTSIERAWAETLAESSDLASKRAAFEEALAAKDRDEFVEAYADYKSRLWQLWREFRIMNRNADLEAIGDPVEDDPGLARGEAVFGGAEDGSLHDDVFAAWHGGLTPTAYAFNLLQSNDPKLRALLDRQSEALDWGDREAYVEASVDDAWRRRELWKQFSARRDPEDLATVLWWPDESVTEEEIRAEAIEEFEIYQGAMEKLQSR